MSEKFLTKQFWLHHQRNMKSWLNITLFLLTNFGFMFFICCFLSNSTIYTAKPLVHDRFLYNLWGFLYLYNNDETNTVGGKSAFVSKLQIQSLVSCKSFTSVTKKLIQMIFIACFFLFSFFMLHWFQDMCIVIISMECRIGLQSSYSKVCRVHFCTNTLGNIRNSSLHSISGLNKGSD